MTLYPAKVHKKRIGNPRYPFMAKSCLKVSEANGELPTTILDIGSSSGVLLSSLRKESGLPRESLTGVDYGLAGEYFLHDDALFLEHDLTKGSLVLEQKFDLINCQEVAEHLEEAFADDLVATIRMNLSDTGVAIFGAAPPGQRGQHHVNLQPMSYWENKFAELGLKKSDKLTSVYRESLQAAGTNKELKHQHYIDNSIVLTFT
jgi:hypothetical protein